MCDIRADTDKVVVCVCVCVCVLALICVQSLPHIPVGVFIEPLVKQATLQRQGNTDFDLYVVLAKHPRLDLRHALLLMDFLGKFCLHDPFLARLASVPFFMVLERFHYSEPVQVEFAGRGEG